MLRFLHRLFPVLEIVFLLRGYSWLSVEPHVKDRVVLLIATVEERATVWRDRGFVERSIMDVYARIDALNLELKKRIDETNRRIDETNKRIDGVYGVLGDVRKTMAGMRNTLLETLKVLAEIQKEVSELKKTR